MFTRLLLPLMVCAIACRSVDGEVADGPVTAVVDAGRAEADALKLKIEALSSQAQRQTARADEALWSHWTQGTPLDLSPDGGVMMTRDGLTTVRRARELNVDDARALKHLENHLVGELLARGVAEENTTIANLEASLTCAVDGKEQRWRELNRQLVNEKSAVKRKALWASCLQAAEQLDAAYQRRDSAMKTVLTSLEVTSALDFATESRELDLDAMAKVSERVLQQTDDRWRATLRELSDNEVKLPVDALTRADLPRLLKVPAAADAAFPKGQIAARALQTLGTLGLYGRPGLTLDLAEAAKKNPLPLTVAPMMNDVRVSFRPLGGLRDEGVLLAELGTALALLSSKTGRFETTRLGDPAIAQVSGALFSSLLGDEGWLTEVKVADGATVRRAWQAQQLFALRKATGTVLARLETSDLPEPEARARFVAIMTRALGVKLSIEDGARIRLESDDFLRSATLLRSMLLASSLRAQLGEGWWRKPESGQALLNLWAKGTALPAETMLGSLMQGLMSSLPVGEGDGGVVKPFLAPQRVAEPVDAGVEGHDPDGG